MRLKIFATLIVVGLLGVTVELVITVRRRILIASTSSELSWMMLGFDKLYSASNQLPPVDSSLHDALHRLDHRIAYGPTGLRDVWGHPYQFAVATNAGVVQVRISSDGPDGRRRTKDDIELEFTLR